MARPTAAEDLASLVASRRERSFLALAALAIAIVGCPHRSSDPAPAVVTTPERPTEVIESAASESKTPPKHPTKVIEFPRQTLTFEPTRADMSVGQAVFSVYSSNPEKVRVNGSVPDPAWMVIDLTQRAKNQFELGHMKIEYATPGSGDVLCLSVKVWFNEVSNQYDALYYEDLKDRYALVSYCTSEPDSRTAKARFGMNRVASVSAFKERLSVPMVLKLNQRRLGHEGTVEP